jgi:orotate phosphoribosyltransferase
MGHTDRTEGHGTWRQIEGVDLNGRRTVLLDDTARTGTSLLWGANLHLNVTVSAVVTRVVVVVLLLGR